MKLEDLSEAQIKEFADSNAIFIRGYEYFKDEMVKSVEYLDESKIHAEVSGNYGDYTIEILVNNEIVEAICDCPYDGYPCKHIIAVLLEFTNHKARYIFENKNKQKSLLLEDRLFNLSKPELVKIILSSSRKYPDFKRELLLLLDAENENTFEEIKHQVNIIFEKDFSQIDIRKHLKSILKSVENTSVRVKAQVYWVVTDKLISELNRKKINDDIFEQFIINNLNSLVKFLKNASVLRPLKSQIIEKLNKYIRSENCGLVYEINEVVNEL